MQVCQTKPNHKQAAASGSPIKANGLDERKRSRDLIDRLQQFDPRGWNFPFANRPVLFSATENGSVLRPKFEMPRAQAQNTMLAQMQERRIIDLPPIEDLCAALGLPEIPSSGKLGQAR
jgi:hypothetical protein